MALSLASALLVLVGARVFPGSDKWFTGIVTSIDFHALMMNGMLGLLLFAGSVNIDARSLRKERLPIITLATVGVLISTSLLGCLLYVVFILFHINVELIYCLLFAALLSPTDPIAVLAILKKAGLSKSLELKIAGESLFNDGVAVVVFLTILEVATKGVDNLSFASVTVQFLRETGGGLLYGLLLGVAGYYTIRSVNKYEVEVLLSMALVMGGYLLAGRLHISGPLAMVAAGIVVGNMGKNAHVPGISKRYLNKYWELIDEMLNAILFMLVGFEMLVIKSNITVIAIGLVCIVLVVFVRWASVAVPVTFLRLRMTFERHAIVILTWGGLRGALSIALALSLPADMHRDLFVTITYVVVVFSVLVQGLSIGKLYSRLTYHARAAAKAAE